MKALYHTVAVPPTTTSGDTWHPEGKFLWMTVVHPSPGINHGLRIREEEDGRVHVYGPTYAFRPVKRLLAGMDTVQWMDFFNLQTAINERWFVTSYK